MGAGMCVGPGQSTQTRLFVEPGMRCVDGRILIALLPSRLGEGLAKDVVRGPVLSLRMLRKWR